MIPCSKVSIRLVALCLAFAGLSVVHADDIRPQVLESFRMQAPLARPFIVWMPEAQAPLVLAPLVPPTQITVLSQLPTKAPSVVALPEPGVAADKKPAAPATAPAATAKPAAPSTTPAIAATTTSPAASTKPAATATAPAAPVTSPSTSAKPAATAPTSAASAPAASAAAPSVPAPATQATALAAQVTAGVVPDVRVDAWKGQRFELRLPGSGWTFLGDEEGKDGVRYETRKFENGEAVFALYPEKAGRYLLRFQRQDPVSLGTANALVELTVLDPATATASTATAPATSASSASPASSVSPPAVSSAPAAATLTPTTTTSATPLAQSTSPALSAGAPTASAPSASAPSAGTSAASADLASITTPEGLLAYARDELSASRIRTAIDALDKYIGSYPYGNDELFYLYGLSYEQDTPFRNIKRAYEYYKRVRDDYPRSKRWREAADRIAYLERHYFGLR